MMRLTLFAVSLLTAAAVCGCGLPRDVEATTAQVRAKVLRVGVLQDDPQAGAQVERLSRELRARVEEVRAPAHVLIEQLKSFELDLVYGGLDQKSPLLAEVASSQPYYEETFQGESVRYVLALPPGENRWVMTVDEILRGEGPPR